MTTVVIYESRYGHTKKYAQWIAEEVKADIFEKSQINIENLNKYNTIVYGGGLYASGISGISFITKNYEKLINKRIIVFTVGLASTDIEEVFTPILDKSFSDDMQKNIEFFHFRGGIDYKNLSLTHKSMMFMMKTIISKKDAKELSEDDKQLLATYGEKVDFLDKKTIMPLVSFITE